MNNHLIIALCGGGVLVYNGIRGYKRITSASHPMLRQVYIWMLISTSVLFFVLSLVLLLASYA